MAMTRKPAAQIAARIPGSQDLHGHRTPEEFAREKLRQEKLLTIGGRPVLVNSSQSASARSRTYSVQMAVAFAAIYLVWGSTYLAIRYAVETIPPLVTAGIRHSIAGVIMLAWAWARGFRPTRANWIAGAILGALFFLIGHGTLHWAEQYVGSGLAALLIATEPMFILVLAWALRQQTISPISALGLAPHRCGVNRERFKPAGIAGGARGLVLVVRRRSDLPEVEPA